MSIELATKIAKPFERLSLKAYFDPHPLGLPTQGYGRLLCRTPNYKSLRESGLTNEKAYEWLYTTFPDITEETAEEWLEADLLKAQRGVLKYTNVALNENQLGALDSFAFNVGIGNYQISTMRRLINRGDFELAGNEFIKWNKAGGIVLRGLTRRRLAERDLWFS